MEIYRKSFLIFLLLLKSCSYFGIMEHKDIELEVNRIDVWFDAMPKIETPSLIHFESDVTLKNLTGKKIEIDSLTFQIFINEDLILNFSPNKKTKLILYPNSSEMMQYKFSVHGSKELIETEGQKSKIYMNLYFRIEHDSFNRKVLIGENEIQVVY